MFLWPSAYFDEIVICPYQRIVLRLQKSNLLSQFWGVYGHVFISFSTDWRSRWRKLSEEEGSNVYDPDIGDLCPPYDDVPDDCDVIDGMGMSRPRKQHHGECLMVF